MNKIFWAGDSTVQTNDYTTYPQTGIGQVFSILIKENYQVENHARNGRSTKSFIDEGRLQSIEERIDEGDFLFIQFGHNDEKQEDPSRYTEPFSSFIDNLEKFISAARDHRARPVLITPLERRCFVDEKHLGMGAHSDYAAAMKQTAKRQGVPLVDLCSMSREELKRAGEPDSRRWFMNFDKGQYKNYPEGLQDNTHLRYEGAVLFGSLIAYGLKELGGVYRDMILEEV